MRKVIGLVALAFVAQTAAAQGGGAGAAPAMKMDETKAVKQAGPLPAGWMVRVDRGANEELNFVAMGPGMHVTTGAPGIFWNPANTATGTYTVSANFAVRSVPLHDYYGLIWGGSDLSGDKESYGYFLVSGDGKFIVKHRAGPSQAMGSKNTDVHSVIDAKADAAIKAAAADGGSATNSLEVRVGKDSVRFVVNGTQVGAVDAKSPMAATSGIYGIRVNHNISVHITDFGKK